MARGQRPAQPARRSRAATPDTMRRAGDDFLSRFGGLVDEVVALREELAAAQDENRRLSAELAEGIDLFREARGIVARSDSPGRRGRGGRPAASTPAKSTGRTRASAGRAARGGRAARASANGRATPAAVTGDVVRAVIGKLGTATAGEIAAQITAAGTPVSGRAIRHIAESAGAVTRRGEDGRMLYSLS